MTNNKRILFSSTKDLIKYSNKYTKNNIITPPEESALDFDVSGLGSNAVYYNFQTGSGTTLFDQVNNVNATLSNASLWTTGFSGAGYGGYGAVELESDVIIVPSSLNYSNGGDKFSFVTLFKSGSSVSGSKYFFMKDGGASAPSDNREFEFGFYDGYLYLTAYLDSPANGFLVWRSTSNSILSVNTDYLLSISFDLGNDSLIVDLNGTSLAGSIIAGSSLASAVSFRNNQLWNAGIGAVYQNNGVLIQAMSFFTFYRVLLSNQSVDQSWINAEVSKFGLSA